MKKLLFFLFTIIILSSISCACSCKEIPVNEWVPFSGVTGFKVNNNILSFSSTNLFPLISSGDNIFVNAGNFNVLKLEMKTNKSYVTGRVFFKRIGDRDFNYNNSIEFQTGLNNKFNAYFIDLGRNSNWFGVITQIMLMPVNAEASIEIKKIGLLEPNLWTMSRVRWQEFFTFERPMPRTINVIFGPKLNGISINVYIYYLIFSSSFLYLIYFSIKLRDFKSIMNSLIPKILLACFFFWVLLDVRILMDQIRYSVLNYQIFAGKSLEEKQALSTFQYYRDFYYFLKICKTKLPERALYSLVVPDGYTYFDIKARYYLYPICEIRRPDEVPDYIIVYDPQKMLNGKDVIPKGYKLFAICNEAGYIVKRSLTP